MDENKLNVVMDKLLALEVFARELRDDIKEIFVNKEIKTESVTILAEKVKVESAPRHSDIKVEPKAKEVAPAPEPKVEEPVVEVDQTNDVDPVNAVIADYGLLEMSAEDLKEFLDGYGIKYTKQMRSVEKLASIVAEAIVDGRIPTEEEENDEVESVEESIPVEDELPVLPLTEEVVVNKADEEEEVEEEEDENLAPEVDFEVSEARAKAEAEIEKDIKSKLFNKKLKVSSIKNFLKDYYDGDADCSDCKGCSEDETIDCYIEIQKSLVDDEGDVMKPEEGYYRNGVLYCCGKECVQDPDDESLVYCEICTSQYEI